MLRPENALTHNYRWQLVFNTVFFESRKMKCSFFHHYPQETAEKVCLQAILNSHVLPPRRTIRRTLLLPVSWRFLPGLKRHHHHHHHTMR